MLRGVVGRCALWVGLLVGGLFVLGFLCGEQAYAADGAGALPVKAPVQLARTPSGPSAVNTPVAPGKGSGPLTDVLAQAPRPADDKVLRPVTEGVVEAVSDRVVRPVGELVETVTTGLTETVGIPPLEALPELPSLPSFPESPSWPALPTAPGPPSVPSLPGTPVQTLPAPTPVTSAPQPGTGGHAVARPADDEGSSSGGAVYGPRFTGRFTVAESTAPGFAHRTFAHRAAFTVQAPAHPEPSDGQGGALGGKSAVDNGSSRHVDAHAVTLHHRAPLWFVAGAAAGVDAAGTRDRHRDIPVFPG